MASPTLRAGPLSALYHDGGLRYMRLGEREVLRRVMVAVRDGNWRTVPGRIVEEKIQTGAETFRIALRVLHRESDVEFEWRGGIEGEQDGTVRWTMDGEALRPFLKNRIGFCVLHPIAECAGQACEVEHTDGSRELSRFPDLIAPHQPFLDVRALSHGLSRVCMTGDVFETEDQRNWSDASFKTYSTPLSRPFPVLIQAGERIRQEVELTLSGSHAWAPPEAGPVKITVDRSKRIPVPAVTGPQQFSFVEWNRNREALRWTIDPRTHAEDEPTMVENLAGQAWMVRTARAAHAGSIHLSVKVPAMRASAGWIAISLRELAQAGAAAVTYDGASPVLDYIREAKPAHLLASVSRHPLRCDALIFPEGAWAVNFTDSPQDVLLDGAALTLNPFEMRWVKRGWEKQR